MNKWAAYDMFGSMRSSTPREQNVYENVLSKYSVPFERSIFDMGEIEVSYCDICHQKKQVQRKYYYYNVNCDCCGGPRGHFEIVKYCNECTPKPPKRVSVEMEPYDAK